MSVALSRWWQRVVDRANQTGYQPPCIYRPVAHRGTDTPKVGSPPIRVERAFYLFHFLINYFTVDHLMSSLFKLTDHHSSNIPPLDRKA